ncbi:MAG: hypothetical protein AAFN70_19080, partial [Planctomycetota bacterium]
MEPPPVAEAAADVGSESDPAEDESPSVDDVLQALQTEAPSTQLPGFGASAKDPDIEDLTAGGPPAVEEPVVEELREVATETTQSDLLFDEGTDEPSTSAWSELAGELGIESSDEP